MKVLVLAAGYGTRLQRDVVENDEFKHLVGVPKALVPLGRYDALISIWLEILSQHFSQDAVKFVTNDACYRQLAEWAERHSFSLKSILNDKTRTNEERLGAVGDLHLAIASFDIQEDLLVIASDTVFYRDFKLQDILNAATEIDTATNLCLYYECSDEETRKTGILETTETGFVVGFKEKPGPEQTESRKACPCFYLLRKQHFGAIRCFLEEKKSADKKEWDATGKLIGWMIQQGIPFHALKIPGRLEVGDLPSYKQSNAYFL